MPRSRKLRQQWELYDRRQYEQAEQQTRSLLPRLNDAERNEAHRLVGLCKQRQDRPDLAVYWLQLACQGSDWAQAWAELAVAAALKGDFPAGEEAFEQVRICHQATRNAQVPGFYLQLYWYACALCQREQGERARAALDELAAAYRRVHHSDPTFLLQRQMPFLPSFLDLLTRFFAMRSWYSEGIAYLEALGEGLDAAGQQEVQQAIDELRQEAGETGERSEA